MSTDPTTTEALHSEAARQLQICNACRYCEGYCAAFPAITRRREFARGDITQIANLCHNCRGCYYACQYTKPHEFALNLPQILAETRRDSWERFMWPRRLAVLCQRHGWSTAVATVSAFGAMIFVLLTMRPSEGDGFYALMSHAAMVTIFLPAFVLPLLSLSVGMRAYWREIGGRPVTRRDLFAAIRDAASLRSLNGGHGDGCNFEQDNRFSHQRRWAHHAVLFGFLLCFAATSSATVLHYAFDAPAPYPFWSLPKMLGVTGGILLTAGCIWMIWLKRSADPALGTISGRGGETAFTALLGFVAASGLALYALGSTAALGFLLALHLGAVLAFFLLSPFSKMAHGFFRMAALVADAQEKHKTR